MHSNILQTCKNVIENSYLKKLGIEFGTSINELDKGRQPIWIEVSDDDLINQPSSSVSAAGLLMDPEIGILAYILPFHGTTDLRKQIKRALALRSQLSIERNYSDKHVAIDERGAWRIVLHWLVDISLKHNWTDQVMGIRRETGFSEELAFEAVFLDDTDVNTQIERYNFPRLLLTTREVFKKDNSAEITQWLSANILVERALTDFVLQFKVPEQCQYASTVLSAMKEFRSISDFGNNAIEPPDSPKVVRSIHIRNFRNLRDVRFEFGSQPISASVIHGPNGTGKSALCEALSIALFQSSSRYKRFADREREQDIVTRDRAVEYLQEYLTPIENRRREPEFSLDGQAFTRPKLINAEEMEETDVKMSGTILTQDMSLEFAQMPAHELGSRILRGYSDLADYVEEFTENRVNQANVERQNFLRELGLSAAITKIETAYERITQREIERLSPPLSLTLVEWLETAERIVQKVDRNLASRWRTWGDNNNRLELAQRIAHAGQNVEKIANDLRIWLDEYNELVLHSTEFKKSLESRITLIRVANTAEKVIAWGEWLEKQSQVPQLSASVEHNVFTGKLNELQIKQKQVSEQQSSAKIHLDHLMQAEAFVQEIWCKEHANECPTCGADHTKQGGIKKVIELLRVKTANEKERLQKEYVAIKTQIESTAKTMPAHAIIQCPITAKEQADLVEALQWLIPEEASFTEWIRVKERRDMLLSAVSVLKQTPSMPQIKDAQEEANRISQKILSCLEQADRVFLAPTNWKPVKEKLSKTLAEIVKKHLPDTLAQLWLELVLNLTSASWLLLERPKLDVDTRRGEKRSIVRVKDRIARYIFNQAEVHTLGLAWFFTRYLTQSRFHHACIIMDDPAHEMDQTSFRDLCRLWETAMRLHRVYGRPLKLIIMLNQESRAIEAARATSGVLSVLSWIHDQEKPVNSIKIIGEDFEAPHPTNIFEKLGT